mgnify:CR=1 FL=1
MQSIRDLFLNGRLNEATNLRNSLLRQKNPEIYSKIQSKRDKLFEQSNHHNFIELLNSVKDDISFEVTTEWRIKSVASILDSLNSKDSNEESIDRIRDLLGYRFWINCNNFSEFPERMITITSLILTNIQDFYEIDYIRLSDFTDHPYQRLAIHLRIDRVHVEILVMNKMFQSTFNRTIYPMWEGHTKGRFDTTNIPFPFSESEIDDLWGIICHALQNESSILPFSNPICGCNGTCVYRKQFDEFDMQKICERVERVKV